MGICGVGCGNWRRLRTVKWLVRIGSVLVAKKTFFSAYARQLGEERLLGYKKTAFSVRAKPTDKEKLFINPPWQHFSTVPKLTCNSPFQISSATVSLQYNIPFSKVSNLASAV